jgi:hypothetical protein
MDSIIEVSLWYAYCIDRKFSISVRQRLSGDFLFRVVDQLRPRNVMIFVKNKQQSIQYFKSLFILYNTDSTNFNKCMLSVKGYPHICLFQIDTTPDLINLILTQLEDRITNPIATFRE